jgi:septum formation protein
MKFILASSSPRRRQLLECLGYETRVFSPSVDEVAHGEAIPVARLNARMKAQSVFESQGLEGADVLIGADTIVVLENRILGKPTDLDDARLMLARLSGHTHQVVTALCLIGHGGLRREFHVVTEVSFRNLSKNEIDSYVQCHECLDKAGAYGVQGAGAALIKETKGSITNVIGLPVEELLYESKLLINAA